MSHDYNICFIDKTGKFQGIVAIQTFATRTDVEELKERDPDVFIGNFYPIEDNYAAIEVNVSEKTVETLCNSVNVDDPLAQEMADSMEYAMRKDYRMFLV